MSEVPERLSAALAGRYRIERQLGQGGMATVYLADDLKHDRQVAIKVLKPELAAVLGADRFVQEIKTTAALQHPHILPLFDSGSVGEGQSGNAQFLFYVMPYIEGETLRDKLNRETQLGIDEAVKITTEVADALDYAHRHGVVHRDIKPENILLHDGRPMVADFGIALALSAAAGGRMTETGMSLGTPHYMSPEQATADKDITARSDVYSLASVLYEMLTGNPPHTGSSAQQIIMRIIAEDVKPVTAFRKHVPPNVAAALGEALEKLPADRFASAKDFAEALNNPAFTVAGPAARAGASAGRPLSRRGVASIVAALVIVAALAGWGWLRPAPTPPPSYQRIVLRSDGEPGLLYDDAAIAPDGSAIVYTDTVGGQSRLWIQERSAADPKPLAPTSPMGLSAGPSFSPDGQWIAYADGRLKKIARQGGAPIQLSDSAAVSSTAWLDNGTIVFVGGSGRRLFATSADGGGTRLVLRGDSTHAFFDHVSDVPGADAVLISSGTGLRAKPTVLVLDLASDSVRPLGVNAVGAWVARGQLVFATAANQLLVAPFDTRHLAPNGSPTAVFQGVEDETLARDGTLLYSTLSAGGTGRTELVSANRDGTATPIDTSMTQSILPNQGLALSPDGTRLAFTATDSTSATGYLYVLRLATGVGTRLTFEGSNNSRPAWSRDDGTILYVSDAGGTPWLWTKHANGSGKATKLMLPETRPIWEGLWSPDGEWLIYRTDDAYVGNGDIYAVPTSGDTTVDTIAASNAQETGPALSPDGRWISYTSTASGRNEIYVRPFPKASDGIWQISTDGGTEPLWAHLGKELFYRNAKGEMVAVAYSATPTFTPGKHTVLFDASPYFTGVENHLYAITPDDQRFIMVKPVSNPRASAGELVLARNWMGK